MRYRQIIALLLVVLLLLSGCGAESAGTAADRVNGNSAPKEDAGLMGSTSTTQTELLPPDQKLIRKVWIQAETENMDDLLNKVEQRISELSGYVEARQVYHGNKSASYSNRSAELTIRIPAGQLSQFLDSIGQYSNITSTREETEDVTLTYVEYQSKKEALETEHARLMELLAKAETMDEILKIESRMTDVRAQLEEIGSQLRLYDNLVSYNTVYLTLNEVREYTVVEDPETVWDRIGAGFAQSWKDVCDGLEDVFVFLICAIPYLIPLSVLGIGVLAVIFLVKKKKKKAKE